MGALATVADGLIGVINSIVDVINKVISWVTGKNGVISKIPSVSTWGVTKNNVPSSGPKVLPGGQSAYMAAGGVISHGTAVVGDNGPELLTMNGGVATVTPINNTTTNLGSINMNIYGAAGQNVNDLADIVMTRIQNAVNQRGAVWA
jgi:hypothetical protein